MTYDNHVIAAAQWARWEWPSHVSAGGREHIVSQQGIRDICEECCLPFRRMTHRTICAACAPAPTTSLLHCIINPGPKETL